jgi:hypothetical protein
LSVTVQVFETRGRRIKRVTGIQQMNSVEKGRGPDLPLSPTPSSSTGRESTSWGNNSQLEEYVDHPLYGLYELTLQGYNIVWSVGQRRGAGFKTARKFLTRISKLIPWFTRAVGGNQLKVFEHHLNHAISLLEHQDTSTEDVCNSLEKAYLEGLSPIIISDEDRRWPGCRNELGQLVVGGIVR